MKRKLRKLRNDINTKRKQNQQDPVLTFKRLISCMKRYQDLNIFDSIPDEFVYDSSNEMSIKIQHLINFYTLEKTFVWGGKTALERKEVVVNDETLTIFIPRNDVPFDIWRRSILVITYERFTKHFISKDSILRPMVYNVKVFHNERNKLYINLKSKESQKIWGIDKKTFRGFYGVEKFVDKVRRSDNPKYWVDFFDLTRDKYGRIQEIMAALVGEKGAIVI